MTGFCADCWTAMGVFSNWKDSFCYTWNQYIRLQVVSLCGLQCWYLGNPDHFISLWPFLSSALCLAHFPMQLSNSCLSIDRKTNKQNKHWKHFISIEQTFSHILTLISQFHARSAQWCSYLACLQTIISQHHSLDTQ